MWRRSVPAWMRQGESRVVEIGWLLNTNTARFIWAEPRRVRRSDPAPKHAKSVNYCPAILEHESRLFEVPCPIDLRLKFGRTQEGKPALINVDGENAGIRRKHLDQMMAIVSPREWRHPDRPVIQVITPYIFISDEPVYMTQMPPFLDYGASAWPGTLIGGRLPIHIWPRPMMWAFEWYDTQKELVLKRGDPWFYARFETFDPTRPMRMVEAELTPELDDQIKGASSVANYVSQTSQLFKVAAERRPAKLLKRKERPNAPRDAEDCPHRE